VPTLKLWTVTCNKTQDAIGSDDPYLCVDGKKVWGPIKAKAGETLIINKQIEFRGNAVVQLWEKDIDPDDLLGTQTVSKNEAGNGKTEAKFTEKGADYFLVYEVANPAV